MSADADDLEFAPSRLVATDIASAQAKGTAAAAKDAWGLLFTRIEVCLKEKGRLPFGLTAAHLFRYAPFLQTALRTPHSSRVRIRRPLPGSRRIGLVKGGAPAPLGFRMLAIFALCASRRILASSASTADVMCFARDRARPVAPPRDSEARQRLETDRLHDLVNRPGVSAGCSVSEIAEHAREDIAAGAPGSGTSALASATASPIARCAAVAACVGRSSASAAICAARSFAALDHALVNRPRANTTG
jgi:hypothetical protein